MCTELHRFTHWHKSRCECLANIVCAAIDSRSVRLDDLASKIPGNSKFASKTRRLQYFFHDFDLDTNVLALLLVAILGPLLGRQWLLALDRTNWTRRGQEVNLLTLAVCLGDLALPLFWIDLGHKGNSNSAQRIELVQRFLDLFGAERIRALTADREFVGKDWFLWLQKARIPFVLRIRDNFQVSAASGRQVDVRNCFRNLRLHESRLLGVRNICGVPLLLGGLRLPGNEFVILVGDGVAGEDIFSVYRDRWQIETLFEKLKSHGFDLEGSRLRGEGKADKLLAALALATAWCYAFGKWHVAEVTPLRLKKHGRNEKSVFRRGLDLLRQILSGCAAQYPRFCRKAYDLIKPKPHALLSGAG
jgi:hypothetical protein